MQGWYYKLFAHEFGPVPMEKLVDLIHDGSLSRTDEVRFGETGTWRLVRSIGPLMAHLPFETAEDLASDRLAQVGSLRESAVGVLGQRSEGQHLDIDFADSVSLVESPEISETDDVTDMASSADAEKPPQFDSRWWCKIGGKEYGPVELPKLIEWIAAGRLLREDQVRFGLDDYVRADELPGLFPDAPAQAGTKTSPEMSTLSSTATMPVTKQKAPESSEGAKSDANATNGSESPAPTQNSTAPQGTSRPLNPAQKGGAGALAAPNASGIRPKLPLRMPPKKKVSPVAALIPIVGGIVGVLLLGALVFVGIQFMPVSTVEDAKRLQKLEKGYKDFLALREAGTTPSKESLDAAQKSIRDATSVVKKELTKLTKKTKDQDKLKGLVKKMDDAAKLTEFPEEKSKNETDIDKSIKELKTAFGPP